MMAERRAYFPSIDILRGFAALSVVVYHVIAVFEWTGFPTTGPLAWFRNGWMGVDLFFVISGLVIGLAAFREIDRCGPAGFARPFMRRRFFRIAPLHYLTVIVFLVLITPSAVHDRFVLNMASYLFFVHNWFPQLPALNGINWTIGVEMQFYLLMVWLAPRMKGARWLGWAAAMLLCAWTWRYATLQWVPAEAANRPMTLSTLATQLPGMLDEFAMGLVLAHLFTRRKAGRFLLSTGGAVLNLVLFVTLAVVAAGWWASVESRYWDTPVAVVFFRSLLGLTFFFLLAFTCRLNQPGWLTWTSPLRYLGTISYGIYLWHLPVLLLLHRSTSLQGLQAALAVIAFTLACASLSWHFFEKPLIDRFSRRRMSGEKGPHVKRGMS